MSISVHVSVYVCVCVCVWYEGVVEHTPASPLPSGTLGLIDFLYLPVLVYLHQGAVDHKQGSNDVIQGWLCGDACGLPDARRSAGFLGACRNPVWPNTTSGVCCSVHLFFSAFGCLEW